MRTTALAICKDKLLLELVADLAKITYSIRVLFYNSECPE